MTELEEALRELFNDVAEVAPAPVKPSREDVARTLFQWDITPDHPQPHPLWDDPHSARLRDLWLSAADAVLALLPGRSEAEVKAEAWDEGYTRGFYDRELLAGDSRDACEGASENPYSSERDE